MTTYAANIKLHVSAFVPSSGFSIVLIIEKPEDGTNAETCSLMFNKKFINIKKRCVD
jgi:hypothetical protein